MTMEVQRPGLDATRALLGYAEKVNEVGRRGFMTAWGDWSAALTALLSEGQWAPPSDTYGLVAWADKIHRTVAGAADLFCAEAWVDKLSTRMSGTYIRALRKERDRTLAAVGSFLQALRAQVASQASAALAPDRTRATSAELVGRVLSDLGAADPSQLQADVLTRVLRESKGSPHFDEMFASVVQSTLKAQAPPPAPHPHPLLQLSLGFGSAPVPPPTTEVAAPAMSSVDVAVPNAPPVEYDLGALTGGAPGTTASGLTYKLAAHLNTIRPLGPASPTPGPELGPATPPAALPDHRYLRTGEAPGMARQVVSDWGLESIRAGPSVTLAAYHRLADAALHDERGGLLTNFQAVVEMYEDQQAEQKRVGHEVNMLQEVLRTAAEDFPVVGADAVAERRHEVGDALLGRHLGIGGLSGVLDTRQDELALTTLVQAYRVHQALEKAQRKTPRGGLEKVMLPVMSSDRAVASSLKLAATVAGRGMY